MKQIIDEVYRLLLAQKDVQEALLGLSLQKRGAAIKNDTDELTNIVGEEYLALSQINKLEKQRMELMAGAAETVGKPEKDITVSDLLDHADSRQRPLLKALREDLLDILTKLKAQNDENRALIETQLEYIGVMLSNIAGSEDPLNNFYDSGGQALDAQISEGMNVLDTEI